MKGEECRRQAINNNFPSSGEEKVIVPHNCCDICARKCTCDEDTCSAKPSHAEQKIKDIVLHGLAKPEWRVVTVEDSNVSELKENLHEYRDTLLTDSSEHLYTSEDLACGLSEMTLTEVVNECHIVFPFSDFCDRYSFARKDIALEVWNTVKLIIYDQSMPSTDDVAGLFESDTYSDISEEDAFNGEYAEVEVNYTSESD